MRFPLGLFSLTYPHGGKRGSQRLCELEVLLLWSGELLDVSTHILGFSLCAHILPGERTVLYNYVISGSRIKNYLHGDFTAIRSFGYCSLVARRDSQTLIMGVFPSIPLSRLKMAEHSLTFLIRDGV